MTVNGGTTVEDKQFVVLTELLMRQLLKLDSIEAEGEAKVQRRAEVSSQCQSNFFSLSVFILVFKLVEDVQFYTISRMMRPNSIISLHMWFISLNPLSFRMNQNIFASWLILLAEYSNKRNTCNLLFMIVVLLLTE